MSDLVLRILLVNIEPVKEAIVVLRRWPRCYIVPASQAGGPGVGLSTPILNLRMEGGSPELIGLSV